MGDPVHGLLPKKVCVDAVLCVHPLVAPDAPVSADGALQPQAVHPWDPHSCVGNFWTRWRRGFVRAMGMYLPVHLATRALVGWRRVRKDAWSALPLTWRALLGAVRSSSFLGMFIGESRNVHI